MNNLNTAEVDFDKIKQNLIEYLKTQEEFKDYNFDGSAINTLLDILAYNTHYAAMYANFGLSETFLDTATQRSSAVSRAKELNYLPRSKTAASALVGLNFTVDGDPEVYTIPRDTVFVSGDYEFRTIRDCTVENNGNNVFIQNLQVFEGYWMEYTYTVESPKDQRFFIPNRNADTRFLTVEVKENVNATEPLRLYDYRNLDFAGVKRNTPVFFLQEGFDGYFDVLFGDGVFGQSLVKGNVVTIKYFVTSGPSANNLTRFSVSGDLNGVENINITTLQQSQGGAERESIESIRLNAPIANQAQNRAVLAVDLSEKIKSEFGTVEAAASWGGEENDPPMYGKIFAAVKPVRGEYFSASQKYDMKRIMRDKYTVASIEPVIVDPDYITVDVDCVVTYDARRHNGEDIRETVKSTILSHFEKNMADFKKNLIYSRLESDIQGSSYLINSVILNLSLKKADIIDSGVAYNGSFNFNNAIHPGAVTSNEFTVEGSDAYWKFMDIPADAGPHFKGNLAIFRESNGKKIFLRKKAGTVNYITGMVTINDVVFTSIPGDSVFNRLVLEVSPGAITSESNSVYSDRNVYTNERDQIILLDTDTLNITQIADSTV